MGIALVAAPDAFSLRFSAGLDPGLAPPGENLSMRDDSPIAVALRRGTPIAIEWLPDFVTHHAALVRAMVDAYRRREPALPWIGARARRWACLD